MHQSRELPWRERALFSTSNDVRDGPYSTGIFALQQPSWIGRCVTPSAVYSEGLTGSSGGHLLTSITPHQWPVESRAQQRRRQKKAISRPQVLELSPGHMLQAGVPGGPVQKTASYKHYQQLEAPIEQQCAGGHYSRCCRSGFQRQPSYHDACNACTATHCLPRREHPMTENQYHILLQHLRDLAGHSPSGLATSTILQAQQHMQQQQMLQHQQLLQQLQVLQQQIHQQMPMQCKSAQEMLPQETQCGHLSGHVPQPQQRSGAPDCGFYAPSRRVESLLDAMQEDRQGPTKKSKHTFDPIVQQQGVVALRKNGGLHRPFAWYYCWDAAPAKQVLKYEVLVNEPELHAQSPPNGNAPAALYAIHDNDICG
ncbi:hypothetical protein cyc_02591 [Cyclospora cayetanensis]|uniref:Uncharacterized protein n=1 Tax=Cyclospora cayetanensis TaxID=88456 RepID=A0A1D3CUR5_9EIME|nr:hypothetical protein cyc_02591 [Cyclospora cayetanensis]